MSRVFIDSSVLVALLTKEEDWRTWVEKVEAATQCFTAPVTVVETIMVVSTLLKIEPLEAERRLHALLRMYGVPIVPVTADTSGFAIRAFGRFGKGRHPARLNLGDCFSYACAREHGLWLLYKGDDFARTDLA